MTDKDDIAALKKEVEALKSALSGKEDKPKKEFVPKTDEEHFDMVHQMNERRMSMAMHPEVVRDLAVLDDATVKGIVADNRNAPTSPTVAIPRSSGSGGGEVRGPSSTPGWIDPTPLGPQPGINWVDAQMIADDVRQRAELKRKLGK
jgi:hypothetical protein